MSTLREKLARLSSHGIGRAAAAAESPLLERPTAGIRASHAPEARPPFLPAVSTAHGPVQFLERTHGAGFVQGRVAIGGARVARPATVAALALDTALAGVDPSGMLLVDTETTGLHGGAGTLPFIVGLSWFEDESLVVRQLFLGRPGQERPLLRMLAEKLEASTLLVTFNGKSFDWPLLRTRFILNRIQPPTPRPHLDLLHCAKRVFKRRLGATRLQDLERAVLGFHRDGDISGAEIPAVYFDWLRDGRTEQLERVLEHNAQDLVSMAAVLVELCRRFEGIEPEDAPEDCVSIARVAERSGAVDQAERFARIAAERTLKPEVAFDALLLLARGAIRRKDWENAIGLLAGAVTLPGLSAELTVETHLVLARLAEHRVRNFALALHHARLGSPAEEPAVHQRRMARLSRRLSR